MTSTKSLRVSGALACLALGLAVSACGASGQTANASSGGQSGYGQGGPGQQGGRPGGFPGGSGKVAAVSGSTAQVQGQGGQVAVTWTATTTFAQQVPAKAADLKAGDCVVAMPSAPASGSSDDSASTTVKAATVRITAAVDGSCTAGLPGRGAGGPADGQGPGGGTPPQGAPEGSAEGGGARANGAGRPARAGAFGTVTAVEGSSFTVASARPASSSSSTTVTTKVTTSSSTTWTTTRATTAKAVQVGRCVTSRGRAGSTGAIAATSITVSQPVDGQCSAGFGPGGARGNGSGQAQDS